MGCTSVKRNSFHSNKLKTNFIAVDEPSIKAVFENIKPSLEKAELLRLEFFTSYYESAISTGAINLRNFVPEDLLSCTYYVSAAFVAEFEIQKDVVISQTVPFVQIKNNSDEPIIEEIERSVSALISTTLSMENELKQTINDLNNHLTVLKKFQLEEALRKANITNQDKMFVYN